MNRQEPQSIGHKLTRRSLLGASSGMAWLIGSSPVIAQRLLVTDVTERRVTMISNAADRGLAAKDPKLILPAPSA